MDRKKIAALPEIEATKMGKVVCARNLNGTLVLDCYDNMDYKGRYCLQENGRHDSYRNQKWGNLGLSTIFHGWYWYGVSEISFNTKHDEEVIQSFLGTKSRYPLQSIMSKEEDYNYEKRMKALGRKQDRISRQMEKVPTLPDAFYDWINDTVFEGIEYMFKVSKTAWSCTACGKIHTSQIPYKNNQLVKCRRTGKMVKVQSRDRRIERREPVLIFQTLDERQSVGRHFTAVKTWEKGGSKTDAYEGVRYFFGKNYGPAGTVEALEGKTHEVQDVSWYYGQRNDADEFEQEWWDTNPKNKRCEAEYCYPEGVKEALAETKFEKMHLESIVKVGWKLQYNKMMINQNLCGFMEYFVKAGLKTLTEETSKRFSSWGGIWDNINIRGTNASEVLGIDMQRFHRLRQADGGHDYLDWLRWQQETEESLSEETLRWMVDKKISPEKYEFIEDRMSPTQVKNYLERQAKEAGMSVEKVFELWKDYLSMAQRMELDIRDAIVYRTKNLVLRHDELVDELNRRNECEWERELKKKYPNLEAVMDNIRERYEYENDQYLLVVPRSLQDIIEDGRQLHHCSASSERYFERISKQETYIMFLRKKTRPLHAWYTLEVEPGGVVRQKRSEYNRQPDLDKVMKFLREWQQVVRERLKEEDKALAEKSRTLRMEEMKDLKKTNERFAGVLEADLMEVG